MDYGNLHLRINEKKKEKGISKNKICKELDIPRTNFNKYCRDGVTRFDTGMICKLCWYLGIEVGELIVYMPPYEKSSCVQMDAGSNVQQRDRSTNTREDGKEG